MYKKNESVGVLATLCNFKVQIGRNKGRVQLSFDAVPNVNFYEFEYTYCPSIAVSVWIKKTCTKKQFLIEGLQSGKEYSFRVAAAASDPSRQITAELSSFVL